MACRRIAIHTVIVVIDMVVYKSLQNIQSQGNAYCYNNHDKVLLISKPLTLIPKVLDDFSMDIVLTIDWSIINGCRLHVVIAFNEVMVTISYDLLMYILSEINYGFMNEIEGMNDCFMPQGAARGYKQSKHRNSTGFNTRSIIVHNTCISILFLSVAIVNV